MKDPNELEVSLRTGKLIRDAQELAQVARHNIENTRALIKASREQRSQQENQQDTPSFEEE